MSDDDEVKCSECPNARHGFDRNASHNAGRYVCECESHTCHAESLRQQLADSEAEGLEQARLLGMSGEREAALLAEIERLKRDQNQLARKEAQKMLDNGTGGYYQSQIVELRQQLAEKDAEMRKMQSDFCKAIDHAISLDIEGVYFLSCWNDGDWDTCREFGFEPSDALTSPKFVKDSTA